VLANENAPVNGWLSIFRLVAKTPEPSRGCEPLFHARSGLGTDPDMGIGLEAIEVEAARLYRLARLDYWRGAAVGELVRGLLGRDALRTAPATALPTDGVIARVHGRWFIYVREGLRDARFIALHELSHWALGPGATEDECDALAVRLLAPRPAFERALKETGPSYTKLARWFGCTETFAALRYGEVTDEPLVVVAPANVRIRGLAYSWPTEPEIRGLARARRLPGLSKATLRDDPSRFALRADLARSPRSSAGAGLRRA
jgi:hypothetical protein